MRKMSLSMLLLSSFAYPVLANDEMDAFIMSIESMSPRVARIANELTLIRHEECGEPYSPEALKKLVETSPIYSVALATDHVTGKSNEVTLALKQSAHCDDKVWVERFKKAFESELSKAQNELVAGFEDAKAKL